jgi:hypothetical protein
MTRPLPPDDRRRMAVADALLETCRPLTVLPPAAHARVKRRLALSLTRWTSRRVRWLQPVVIASALLLCGGAFGIALDRMVLRRSSIATGETTTVVAPAKRHSRPGKASSHPVPSLVVAEPPAVSEVPEVATGSPSSRPLPRAELQLGAGLEFSLL